MDSTPAHFASLGNLLVASKNLMLEVEPQAWAESMASPSDEAKATETTRRAMTRDFLFPMIDAAEGDVLGFLQQVLDAGLEEKEFFSLLTTALEFDRANALFHMKIAKDDQDCPVGMPWNAKEKVPVHTVKLTLAEPINPEHAKFLSKHEGSLNKRYVRLFQAEGVLHEKIHAAMEPLLEFKTPSWIK